MRRPTAEECSARATIEMVDNHAAVAFWWPQMGGYAGRAVAVLDEDDHLDVWVWHDGEFPFDGQCPNCQYDRRPVKLHLCAVDKLVSTFQFLSEL